MGVGERKEKRCGWQSRSDFFFNNAAFFSGKREHLKSCICIPSLLEEDKARVGLGLWLIEPDQVVPDVGMGGHLGRSQTCVTVCVSEEGREIHLGVCGDFSLG